MIFEEITDKLLELLKVTGSQIQKVKLDIVERVGTHQIFHVLSCISQTFLQLDWGPVTLSD